MDRRASSPKWFDYYVDYNFDQDASAPIPPPQHQADGLPEREHIPSTMQTPQPTPPPPSPDLPPSLTGWINRDRSAQRCDGEVEHREFAGIPSVPQPRPSTATHNHGRAGADILRPQKAPFVAGLEQYAAHVNGDQATRGNQHRLVDRFFDAAIWKDFGHPIPQASAHPMPDPFMDPQRFPTPAPWWGNLSSATTNTVAKSSPAANLAPVFEAQRRTMQQIKRTVGKMAPIEPKKEMPPSSSPFEYRMNPRMNNMSGREFPFGGYAPPSSSPMPRLEDPFWGDAYTSKDVAPDSENPLTKNEIAWLEEARLRDAQPPKKPTVSLPAPTRVPKYSAEKTESVDHVWQQPLFAHHTLSFDKEAARKAVEEGAKTWAKPSKRLSDQIKASSLPRLSESKQEKPEAPQTKPMAPHKYANEIAAAKRAKKEFTDSCTAKATPIAPPKPHELKSESTKTTRSIPAQEEQEQLAKHIHEGKPDNLHPTNRPEHEIKDMLGVGRKMSDPTKQIEAQVQATQNRLPPTTAEEHYRKTQAAAKLQASSAPSRNKAKKSSWVSVSMPQMEAEGVKKEETVKKEQVKPKKTMDKKTVSEKRVDERVQALEDAFEDLSLGSDEEEGWEKVSGDLDEWEVVDGLVG